MDFKTLYERISPRLKRIAKKHNGHGFFIDEEDLYQEMCLHLWNRFKNGKPFELSENYIVKSCEFHLLNYLRTKREKVKTLSLEETINENGDILKDIFPDKKEPLDNFIDKKLIIKAIKNNGLTEREKKIFSLLLKGHTVREIGRLLGISHVMVIKYKNRLIERYKKRLK
jgi:RNA polymerase sigma factor (sigma-70 family)